MHRGLCSRLATFGRQSSEPRPALCQFLAGWHQTHRAKRRHRNHFAATAMGKSVVIVNTSAGSMGGGPTGVWLSELADPYYAFQAAGLEVTVASIAGKRAAQKSLWCCGGGVVVGNSSSAHRRAARRARRAPRAPFPASEARPRQRHRRDSSSRAQAAPSPSTPTRWATPTSATRRRSSCSIKKRSARSRTP